MHPLRSLTPLRSSLPPGIYSGAASGIARVADGSPLNRPTTAAAVLANPFASPHLPLPSSLHRCGRPYLLRSPPARRPSRSYAWIWGVALRLDKPERPEVSLEKNFRAP